MKTTVEIDDELLRSAKRAAIDRRSTLRQLIEGGLRRELAATAPRAPIEWVSATGEWPKDVDFSDREAMWRWIEAEETENKKTGT